MTERNLPLNPVVPDDLVERDQWVLWRRETSNGRETKVPYTVLEIIEPVLRTGMTGPSFKTRSMCGAVLRSGIPG